MHQAVKHIHNNARRLRDEHRASDDLGRLTDSTRNILLESGGMKLLQARSHGGFEAHPTDFFAWVRAVGQYNPAAGWVAGVVGVHPWEIALTDPRLQDEIYQADPNVLVASPYAPQGRAVRQGDGYRLSGHWQYSTGADHCDWVVLGGIVVDESASQQGPPEIRHFFLPRSDYRIVEDSWQVMGLSGTGSKDVIVENALVPEYRTMLHGDLSEGLYGARRSDTCLYQLPFGCVFSAAIAAGSFGIAAGAIEQYHGYMETRKSAMGVVGKTDPFQQEALAEVEADLAAGITHVDVMVNTWLDQLAAGNPITTSQRLEFRRNQVRAVQRVLFGMDKLMSRAGSAAVWSTRPLERYWRDLRTSGSHICGMADVIYGAWANDKFATGINTLVMH